MLNPTVGGIKKVLEIAEENGLKLFVFQIGEDGIRYQLNRNFFNKSVFSNVIPININKIKLSDEHELQKNVLLITENDKDWILFQVKEGGRPGVELYEIKHSDTESMRNFMRKNEEAVKSSYAFRAVWNKSSMMKKISDTFIKLLEVNYHKIITS